VYQSKRQQYRDLDPIVIDSETLQSLPFFSICQTGKSYILDYDNYNNKLRLSDEAGNFVADVNASFLKANYIRTLIKLNQINKIKE
jgi:hypothetical protein